MERLFAKFPSFVYNDTLCCDITRRAVIDVGVKRSPNVFYPLVLKAGIRPDSIADAYYEDSELDWLIWLTNSIVDPYHQWYLSEEEFQDYIDHKYGSIEEALEQILYYRNNWAGTDEEISPSYYNSTLPNDWKQYYSPNWGHGATILSYSRKKTDWTVSTNRILQYDLITYSTGNSYTAGEKVDLLNGVTETGSGQVIASNSTTVSIQHVAGNTTANSTLTLTVRGETSNTHATTNSVGVVYEIISNSEAIFWTAVTAFDWENEQNEKRKHLQILDNSYSLTVAEGMRLALKDE